MKITSRFALTALAAFAAAPSAPAMNLLTFGDFETPAIDEVPSWQLLEYRSANPAVLVNSAELQGFGDNPLDPQNINTAHRGLWLRPFVGTVAAGTVDAILSQTVAATPGKTYSFAGDGRFETNYLGGLGTSPGFRTEFEMAFLDSMGAVIGSPLVRDLTTEVINGLGYSGTGGNPDITPLIGVAPAGAASVRVRAQGLNMTTNTANSASQSAFVDNFSLVTFDAPTSELLANPNLNILPPTPEDLLDDVYTFGETPSGADSLQVANFAQSTLAPSGVRGVWVRPFLSAAQGGTAALSQTVSGTSGMVYTFSAQARWETNFVGTLVSSENATSIVLSFLDGMGVELGSSSLNLRADGKTAAANNWTSHTVSALAPAGTAQVRVAGVVSNLTNNSAGGGQSAFWDNFSLTAAEVPEPTAAFLALAALSAALRPR